MSKFRVPHTLVLLFAMVLLAQLATYILPQGRFDRTTNDHHREQVVAGTYKHVDEPRLAPWAALTAVPKGFDAAREIIFFVFIVGGAFAVFRATGAVDSAVSLMLRRLGNYPLALIAGGIFVFAVGSSTIGMAEEYLPFVPILLALCIGLGFDAVTAVGILCVGYGVGYGVATINPFQVLIAQDVAGLEPVSGLGFRLILLLVFFIVGVHHVWRYAMRVKADPSLGLVADQEIDPNLKNTEHKAITPTHFVVLATTVLMLALMVYGIKYWDWYLLEMGAVFLGLTLLLGAIARLSPDKIAGEFCVGAGELTTTALLIGIARSIQIVLDEGMVVDTIINGIAQPLSQAGPSLAALGMFMFQSVCNFFIPSGSGQAYVTMPVMAPLADLVGVSRQVAVLAFQFGDGFTNILVPTNAVLVGILAMARVPYDRWLRFVLPFMIKVWVIGSIALLIAVWIGYK